MLLFLKYGRNWIKRWPGWSMTEFLWYESLISNTEQNSSWRYMYNASQELTHKQLEMHTCIFNSCYWCPGAKAPGHRYPQCWLNIYCIRLIACSYIHCEQHCICFSLLQVILPISFQFTGTRQLEREETMSMEHVSTKYLVYKKAIWG